MTVCGVTGFLGVSSVTVCGVTGFLGESSVTGSGVTGFLVSWIVTDFFSNRDELVHRFFWLSIWLFVFLKDVIKITWPWSFSTYFTFLVCGT